MKTNRSLLILVSLIVSVGVMSFSILQLKDGGHARGKGFDYVVRESMFAGFNGDSAALEKAIAICADTLRVNPDHAEALVWHGSAIWYLSGKAFRAGDFQRGMALSDSGMGEMDRAVALDSNNVAVIIPRGASLLAAAPYIQEPYGSAIMRKGLGDYERSLALQQRYFTKLPVHLRGELLGGIADSYRRLGETEKARDVFIRMTTELQGSQYAKLASKWLNVKDMQTNKTLQPPTCLGCHTEN